MKSNIPAIHISVEEGFKHYAPEMLIALYRIEQKSPDAARYVEKMRDLFKDLGWIYENPFGESYTSDRIDVVIDSSSDQDGEITDVFSPIIIMTMPLRRVVKKGEVTVKNNKKQLKQKS